MKETKKNGAAQSKAGKRDYSAFKNMYRKIPQDLRDGIVYYIGDRPLVIHEGVNEVTGEVVTAEFIRQWHAMSRKAYELTGLENPNSVSQLKTWLEERGIPMDTLGKKDVAQMIEELDKNGVDAEAMDRHPDRSGHGGLCRLLSGVCPMEGGRGVHYPARHYRQDPVRVLAAGAAGVHRPDLSEDHEQVCRAVRSDPVLPKPDHCFGRRSCGCS